MTSGSASDGKSINAAPERRRRGRFDDSLGDHTVRVDRLQEFDGILLVRRRWWRRRRKALTVEGEGGGDSVFHLKDVRGTKIIIFVICSGDDGIIADCKGKSDISIRCAIIGVCSDDDGTVE